MPVRTRKKEDSPSCRILKAEGALRKLTGQMLTRMHVPQEFWTVTLEKVPADERAVVTKYLVNIVSALNQGIGFIVNGEYGTGKTSIGVLCLKQCRRVGGTGLYVTAASYINDVINCIQFDDAQSIQDRAEAVDLLVLDDLGKEAVNFDNDRDATAAMFVSLVKERASRQRSTIVTTNLSTADFSGLYGESFLQALKKTNGVLTTSYRHRTSDKVRNFFSD